MAANPDNNSDSTGTIGSLSDNGNTIITMTISNGTAVPTGSRPDVALDRGSPDQAPVMPATITTTTTTTKITSTNTSGRKNTMKCVRCGKLGRDGCTQMSCIHCCSDDTCLVHQKAKQHRQWKTAVLAGTTDVQKLAQELRMRRVPPGLFRESAFRYSQETIVLWDIRAYWKQTKWRDDAIRKARRRSSASSPVLSSSAKPLRNSIPRFRRIMEHLYRQSLNQNHQSEELSTVPVVTTTTMTAAAAVAVDTTDGTISY